MSQSPTSFNLTSGQKAERKLLVTAVNVGDSISATSGTPVWEVIGAGIEDSAIEYNPDISTTTDILGTTTTLVNKLEPSQEFEPYTITGGSQLAFKLWGQIKENKLSELSMYEVMQIHAFVGSTGSYEAEVHKNCTITAQSIGGSAYVDFPITINFSNDKVHGTASGYKASDTISFTAAS